MLILSLSFHHHPACGRGFYKSSSQDLQCSRCPAHSYNDREGSWRCDCEDGYYRALSDPASVACTRPPSAPQNMLYNINHTTVSLEWTPPADTGGRNDVTYRIICRRCTWEPERVLSLREQSHANYTFEVEAVNGVSDLSRTQRLFAAVSIATSQA
ncbi:ephrin type-A receptor 7-like, partial [Carassius auratus]|uniref:Ephrin type-A receptor 7-like n=1 Tax=Carassius auratus TaxID=7957 RepID=A0A6P6MY51_CARAU